MKKKTLLGISFGLATLLVAGQASYAATVPDNATQNNTTGMMSMMNNANMGKMMEAVNSPEGQKMVNACSNFMDSYDSNTGGQQDKKN